MGDEHIDRLKLPNNHFESTVSKLDSSLNSSCERAEADTASFRSTKAMQARRVVPNLMRNRPTSLAEFARYAEQRRNADNKQNDLWQQCWPKVVAVVSSRMSCSLGSRSPWIIEGLISAYSGRSCRAGENPANRGTSTSSSTYLGCTWPNSSSPTTEATDTSHRTGCPPSFRHRPTSTNSNRSTKSTNGSRKEMSIL
ncbi:MAG: hypothetical protein JWP89_4616 [Schlesneria sp.]|nr:hypothetical protein [Schlesneria sp.]